MLAKEVHDSLDNNGLGSHNQTLHTMYSRLVATGNNCKLMQLNIVCVSQIPSDVQEIST